MSRSAAAPAYDLETTSRLRNTNDGRTRLRLLGESEVTGSWQGIQMPSDTLHREATQDRHSLSPEVDWPMAFAPDLRTFSQEREDKRPQVRHPAWLFGTFVGVAALLLVVGPTILGGFRGSSSRPFALTLSGYNAVSAVTDDTTAKVFLVDVSTSGHDPARPQNVASVSSGPYDITGSPSISVGQIEAVLQQYGSPAIGKGQALFDMGLRYGINPAYALAFFVHESGCGTKGVARVTHSIGNIRWTEGHDNYEGYRSYVSWDEGIEDWYKLISDLYISGWHLRTVDAIVPIYAPYGDNNNPPVYIAAVKQMVDAWRGK